MKLSLEIVEGPDAGRRIELTGPAEIGRQPDVTLVVRDELVSRRHARLTPASGGVTVEDLGSRNGTFINGNELHAPTLATPGDQILVGTTVIELRSAEQIQQRPSAVRPIPPPLATPPRQPDYLAPQGAGPAAGPPGGGPPRPGERGLAPVGRKPEVPVPELDPLLDIHTKRRALIAPLAVFVVVVLVVLVFLAVR